MVAKTQSHFERQPTWYDTEHYHSGIDYVTPQQAHQGLRPPIVTQRQSNNWLRAAGAELETKSRKPENH